MTFEVRSIADEHRFVLRQVVGTEERRSDGVLVGYESQSIVGPDWFASGGLLPPRARVAHLLAPRGEIVATVNNGAWVACAPEPARRPGAPMVRFLDMAEEIVALPWPENVRPLQTLDHDAAKALPCSGSDGECMVCGAHTWLAGVQPGQPGQRIACARCGYSDGSLVLELRTDTPGASDGS